MSDQDWALKAAERICYAHGLVWPEGDGVRPSPHTLKSIASVIVEHVPRCATCRHFGEGPSIKPHCMMLRIEVRPDFGCLNWRSNQ